MHLFDFQCFKIKTLLKFSASFNENNLFFNQDFFNVKNNCFETINQNNYFGRFKKTSLDYNVIKAETLTADSFFF